MWLCTRPFRYRGVSYAIGDRVPAEGWTNRRALTVTKRIREVSEIAPTSTAEEAPQAPPDPFKMKREELNSFAESLGIADAADRTVYPNREVLLDKIEEVQAPKTPEPPADDSGGSSAEDEDDDPFADLEDEEE